MTQTGSYINIEADRIPFTDNVYDFVFTSFVLLEMSSLNQIQQTLNEATRVLKNRWIIYSNS